MSDEDLPKARNETPITEWARISIEALSKTAASIEFSGVRSVRHLIVASSVKLTGLRVTLRMDATEASPLERAIEIAVRNEASARARRLAERKAIFSTMEQFGLITQTRGDAKSKPVICEHIL